MEKGAEFELLQDGKGNLKIRSTAPWVRYVVTVWHGELHSIFYVVDTINNDIDVVREFERFDDAKKEARRLNKVEAL